MKFRRRQLVKHPVEHALHPGSEGYSANVVAIYEELHPTLEEGADLNQVVRKVHKEKRLTENKAYELLRLLRTHHT